MPSHNTLPTSFSLPISGATAPVYSNGFDFNSVIPSDYDWRNPGGPMMDLDVDEQGRITTPHRPTNRNPRKLEFVDAGSDALGLGDLDISFDTSRSENGKIRVKIHSSSSSAAASSSTLPSSIHHSRSRSSSSSSLAMWAGAQSDPTFGTTFNSPPTPQFHQSSAPTSDGDPFFGVGTSHTGFGLASPMSLTVPMGEFSSPVGYGHHTLFGLGSDFPPRTSQPSSSGKRRVRIALKSMPTIGGEGGEWEVELR